MGRVLFLSPELTSRAGVPRRWVHSVESFHHCVIETDASDDFWAAVLRDKRGRVVFRLRGEYTAEQKRHSSTWREFFAFVVVLEILGRAEQVGGQVRLEVAAPHLPGAGRSLGPAHTRSVRQ